MSFLVTLQYYGSTVVLPVSVGSGQWVLSIALLAPEYYLFAPYHHNHRQSNPIRDCQLNYGTDGSPFLPVNPRFALLNKHYLAPHHDQCQSYYSVLVVQQQYKFLWYVLWYILWYVLRYILSSGGNTRCDVIPVSISLNVRFHFHQVLLYGSPTIPQFINFAASAGLD